jgi:dinuclear metal center YbgI/SA1388 family protein
MVSTEGEYPVLVEDLEAILEDLAPVRVAEPWDNVGLLVGRRGNEVKRVLVALDLTSEVLVEAVTDGVQAIVTHHPLLFDPVRKVTDDSRVGVLLQQLVAADISLFACHTNLDGASGGLCDLLAGELGLVDVSPLQHAAAGQRKFVGFVPPDHLDKVKAALFAAGAGRLGAYEGCAFGVLGRGEFRPLEGAKPAVGRVGRSESVDEVRFETLIPDRSMAAVIRAFLAVHPYEEPAFDVYSVENRLVSSGIGRVGRTRVAMALVSFAEAIAETLGLERCQYVGEPGRLLDRVAVVTGSGAGLIESAAEVADVLVTGDLKYHDAERAVDSGIALVGLPHFEMECWALETWSGVLAERLQAEEVPVAFARASRSPWKTAFRAESSAGSSGDMQLFDLGQAEGLSHEATAGLPSETGTDGYHEPEPMYLLRIDGGSRGNPGPSAIGIVLEDPEGVVLEEIGAQIGHATNNVAEYQALVTGLETALDRGVARLRIHSDSELLVRQLRHEYKVKNAVLKELFLQATGLVRRFDRVEIRHVAREENTAADRLVNVALDEAT